MSQASELEYIARDVPTALLEDGPLTDTHPEVVERVSRALHVRDWSDVAIDIFPWLTSSLYQVTSGRVGLAVTFEALLELGSDHVFRTVFLDTPNLVQFVANQRISSTEDRTVTRWLFRCCARAARSCSVTSLLWLEWVSKGTVSTLTFAESLLVATLADATSALVPSWEPSPTLVSALVGRVVAQRLSPRAIGSYFVVLQSCVRVTSSPSLLASVAQVMSLEFELEASRELRLQVFRLCVSKPAFQEWWLSSLSRIDVLSATPPMLACAAEFPPARDEKLSDSVEFVNRICRQADRISSSITKAQREQFRPRLAELRASLAQFSVSIAAEENRRNSQSSRRANLLLLSLLLLGLSAFALALSPLVLPDSQLAAVVDPWIARARLLVSKFN